MRQFLLAASVALLCAGIGAVPATAHNKQLAADGCHHSKDEERRHFHKPGTTEAAGECVNQDGQTVKVMDIKPVQMVTVPADVYDALVTDRDQLRADMRAAGDLADQQAATIRSLQHQLDTATKDALAARREADHATEIARQAREDATAAEARAAGHGAAVSPRCRRGVIAALDTGRLGWGSSAKTALERACLE